MKENELYRKNSELYEDLIKINMNNLVTDSLVARIRNQRAYYERFLLLAKPFVLGYNKGRGIDLIERSSSTLENFMCDLYTRVHGMGQNEPIKGRSCGEFITYIKLSIKSAMNDLLKSSNSYKLKRIEESDKAKLPEGHRDRDKPALGLAGLSAEIKFQMEEKEEIEDTFHMEEKDPFYIEEKEEKEDPFYFASKEMEKEKFRKIHGFDPETFQPEAPLLEISARISEFFIKKCREKLCEKHKICLIEYSKIDPKARFDYGVYKKIADIVELDNRKVQGVLVEKTGLAGDADESSSRDWITMEINKNYFGEYNEIRKFKIKIVRRKTIEIIIKSINNNSLQGDQK